MEIHNIKYNPKKKKEYIRIYGYFLRAFKKEELIRLMGGKCQQCGFSDSNVALEFHHKNSDLKSREKTIKGYDLQLKQVGHISKRKDWRELFEKEKDNLIILCANCHRIEHGNQDDKRILKEIDNYNK